MNITDLCVKLRLPYARDNWHQLVDEAKNTKQDYVAFLESLLDGEWHQRLQNGQQRRIKDAKFPLKNTLLIFKEKNMIAFLFRNLRNWKRFYLLRTKKISFLLAHQEQEKTHYSIALGIDACMKGYNVFFASVPNLIVDLKETMSQGGLSIIENLLKIMTSLS